MIQEIEFFNANEELVLKKPTLKERVFVAQSADVLGDVHIGEDSSIWYQCVLRGDVMPIKIGERTNIQDLTMIHGTFKKFPVNIGDEVTVGHGATLHGCTIEDRCFIGMNATLLDGVYIEKSCFVAAGSLLTPGKRFPSGSMIMGSPARVVRRLTDAEFQELEDSYIRYKNYKDIYLKQIE